MNVDLTALAAAARSEIDALNMDDSSED
jgi:hypothetical protein